MTNIRRLFATASAVAVMSGVFGTTATHAFPGDEKVFPASMCTRTSGGSPFYDNNGRFFNNLPISSSMTVVCPLVRDDVLGRWDTVQVTVIDQHLSQNVSCRVVNLLDSAGGVIGFTGPQTTVGNGSSGQDLLFTTAVAERDRSSFVLRCTIPVFDAAASGIVSYLIAEN